MNANKLFMAGKLAEAVAAQTSDVQANPADPFKRLFLAELFLFSGELEQSRKELDSLHYDQPAAVAEITAFRLLLDAETARRWLFRKGLKPQFLTDPPERVRLRLEGLSRIRDHRFVDGEALLEDAAALCPPFRGQLNGKPFQLLRDCDDLFSDVLEVMSQGNYYWLPFEQIGTLTLEPPQFPRDLYWLPGRLEIPGSPAREVFVPALYPGSHEHPDGMIRLGRTTDWQTIEDGPVLGVGARMFQTDAEPPISLLEWRKLTIEPAPPA